MHECDVITNMQRIVTHLAELLISRQYTLSVAESCTGGYLAKLCTDLAGSSAWFERGFITYSNQAKIDMLCVPPATISQFGAVSQETVTAMAQGALANSVADCTIAISGVAGPGGATPSNPVGSVWFGWAQQDHGTVAKQQFFGGDREAVRAQAVEFAIEQLIELIKL